MSATAHAHAPAHSKHGHSIPLWGLFLALLALTAAEVGLFEFWSRTNLAGHPFIPKFAMVLLLLIFTLPKAAIVMIYFMHLKFEKQLVVLLAIIPFFTAAIAILVTTTDNQTLRADDKMDNHVPALVNFAPNKSHGHGEHAAGEHGSEPKSEAPAGEMSH
jgi:caa(3)-type oxidase subunit IV